MNKDTNLKTMDILLITVIVIQFVLLLLIYETELLFTIITSMELVFLISYLIYSIRLRASFEEVINQEDIFFERQFNLIKDQLDGITYQISEYFDRQNDIADLRRPFRRTKMYYQKKMKSDLGKDISIDLLLLTNKGIFIIDFFEARMILKGDFSQDLIDVQYSKNSMLQILNPLSELHPLYQEVKNRLNVDDDAMKRMIIIENESYVAGMHTLSKNQEIAKEVDIPKKIRKLHDQSDIDWSIDYVKELEDKMDELIIG